MTATRSSRGPPCPHLAMSCIRHSRHPRPRFGGLQCKGWLAARVLPSTGDGRWPRPTPRSTRRHLAASAETDGHCRGLTRTSTARRCSQLWLTNPLDRWKTLAGGSPPPRPRESRRRLSAAQTGVGPLPRPFSSGRDGQLARSAAVHDRDRQRGEGYGAGVQRDDDRGAQTDDSGHDVAPGRANHAPTAPGQRWRGHGGHRRHGDGAVRDPIRSASTPVARAFGEPRNINRTSDPISGRHQPAPRELSQIPPFSACSVSPSGPASASGPSFARDALAEHRLAGGRHRSEALGAAVLGTLRVDPQASLEEVQRGVEHCHEVHA
jgi:hypothetical protein